MTLTELPATLRRAGLVGAVVALAALSLVLGSRPAGASHTEIYFTFPVDPANGHSAADCGNPNPTTPPPAHDRAILVPGGPQRIACLWVANVDDQLGAASLQVDVAFDTDVVSAVSAAESTAWLLSTGRQLFACNSAIEELVGDPLGPPNRWHVDVGCTTSETNPLGPQGSGLLATIWLQPGPLPGVTPLAHINTYLNPVSAVFPLPEIPAQLRTPAVVVTRCADFMPPGDPDGWVTISDIFAIVQNFGTTDPALIALYDLNGDGAVVINDILIVVWQFGTMCPV